MTTSTALKTLFPPEPVEALPPVETQPPAPPLPATLPVPVGWQVDPFGTRFARNAGRHMVKLDLFAPFPHADVVAEQAVQTAAVRERILTTLRASSVVARWQRLESEQQTAQREQQQLTAKLSRLQAERNEALTVAAEGLGARLVSLDKEIGEITQRQAEAQAVLTSLAVPYAEARKAALYQARQELKTQNESIATELWQWREVLLSNLVTPELAQKLSQLSAIDELLYSAGFIHIAAPAEDLLSAVG